MIKTLVSILFPVAVVASSGGIVAVDELHEADGLADGVRPNPSELLRGSKTHHHRELKKGGPCTKVPWCVTLGQKEAPKCMLKEICPYKGNGKNPVYPDDVHPLIDKNPNGGDLDESDIPSSPGCDGDAYCGVDDLELACRCFSCVSGKTGVIRKASNAEKEVVKVSDLLPGDKIRGLDASLHPSDECEVLDLEYWGKGTLFGNYTPDHYIYKAESGKIVMHGLSGEKSSGDKYEVTTTCPLIKDEAGVYFSSLDGVTHPPQVDEDSITWEEYLRIYEWLTKLTKWERLLSWLNAGPKTNFLDLSVPQDLSINVDEMHGNIIQCILRGVGCTGQGFKFIRDIDDSLILDAKLQLEDEYGIFLPDNLLELKTAYRYLYQFRIRPAQPPALSRRLNGKSRKV